MFPLEQVTIVGIGLLGGSLGLALQKRKLADRVVGVGRDREALDAAAEAGVITDVADSIEEGAKSAELVVVCTPVGMISEHVLRAARASQRSQATFTDVGSTKGRIVFELENSLPPGTRYIGSHPFAGWHRTGYKSASANLFDGHPVVLTPTANTAQNLVTDMRLFWERLGGHVTSMSPEEHDAAAAMVSHLPHVLAATLAGGTPKHWLPFVAGSWRDATRVASSSSALWVDIFMSNRASILDSLSRFRGRFDQWIEALEQGNTVAIEKLWQEGKEHRNAVGD